MILNLNIFLKVQQTFGAISLTAEALQKRCCSRYNGKKTVETKNLFFKIGIIQKRVSNC